MTAESNQQWRGEQTDNLANMNGVDAVMEQERKIHEIRSATPLARWEKHSEDEYGVVVKLPHGCYISATLKYADAEPDPVLYIDMITVHEHVQGNAIGTRLVRALLAETAKFQPTVLDGNITGKGALATIAKVCGKENLRLFSGHNRNELHLTFDEAMQQDPINFRFVSDLTRIDTTQFEKPEKTAA